MNSNRNESASKPIPLAKIRTDGGTQPRAEIDMDVVADYAAAIKDGVKLPSVIVFFDGTDNWLADGFHRLEGHRAAGVKKILADIRQGTQRDAILYSVGANAAHGLRRSRSDKWRAVDRLLSDANWSKWSDREIAKRCAVSHTFVAEVRRHLSLATLPARPLADPAQNRTYNTRHGTPAVMSTASIGKRRPAPLPCPSLEEGVIDDEPAPPAAPTMVTDETGKRIADKDIIAAFSNRPLFREFMREMSKLKSDFRRLTSLPGGAWAGRRVQEFEALVNNLHAQLRFSIPYAICPYCGGAKCAKCKQTGWLPEDIYKAVPEDIRGGGVNAA
jgi:hypothetical protein